jgi:hypothetical protein
VGEGRRKGRRDKRDEELHGDGNGDGSVWVRVGKEGRREGGKEGRREGGKETRVRDSHPLRRSVTAT